VAVSPLLPVLWSAELPVPEVVPVLELLPAGPAEVPVLLEASVLCRGTGAAVLCSFTVADDLRSLNVPWVALLFVLALPVTVPVTLLVVPELADSETC